MGPSSRRSIAVLAALMAISACSSSGESDSPVDSQQPADSVRPNPATGTPAEFGVPTSVGDLKVTASDPVIGTDDGGPWLAVTMRAENRSPIDVQTPQLELRCSGSNAGGSWMETSTFLPGVPVAAGQADEGTINLLLPGDERSTEPRTPCAAPATVVATLLVFDNAGAGAPVQKRVGWALPDQLVDELNEAPQPT
jgi:hypothetical protein